MRSAPRKARSLLTQVPRGTIWILLTRGRDLATSHCVQFPGSSLTRCAVLPPPLCLEGLPFHLLLPLLLGSKACSAWLTVLHQQRNSPRGLHNERFLFRRSSPLREAVGRFRNGFFFFFYTSHKAVMPQKDDAVRRSTRPTEEWPASRGVPCFPTPNSWVHSVESILKEAGQFVSLENSRPRAVYT